MNTSLEVQLLDSEFALQDYFAYQNLLSAVDWNALNIANWEALYPDRPKVDFQIAHNNKAIVLHYTVEEQFIKAQYVRPNEAVWEDSCVEFFISFDNKEHYYNLEFNPLGTGLIGYGTSDKQNRKRLSAEDIRTLETFTSVTSTLSAKRWSMVLVIPLSVFSQSSIDSLSGNEFHANFYKCGDNLPNPHFISWTKIDNGTPNFHLPEYFGSILFK
ncbi:carbohydrate-binding family 9-like protein [Sphingobacterium hungaricum]